MLSIKKAPETMTGRERIKRTFAYEKTDRVPIGYDANEGIHTKLKQTLDLAQRDDEALYEALGVDYRGIFPRYIGPELFQEPVGRRVVQTSGAVLRWIEHESGGYWDYCDFPLKDASNEAFTHFPIPNPDDFDYSESLEKARSFNGKYALHVGGPGTGDVINSNGMIMGTEDILCHLITENEAAMDFIHRRSNFQLGMMERLLDKCDGFIDFMWLGEDLGTHIAPMISLDLYRRVIKPMHKQFADLAAAYEIPTLMHTCGSSSWVYEDMIEIGIKGVDTLQPEAANMSPEYLVSHFGGRLNFRGCISTAGALAYGTAKDVQNVCEKTLAIMKPTKGYHFAPTHAIQDNSPVENVVAMYQAAHDYGRY